MSWSNVSAPDTAQWGSIGSQSTARNTGRFVLLSKVGYSDDYVNLQPAFRSGTPSGRGPSFYFTEDDPVILLDEGDPTL